LLGRHEGLLFAGVGRSLAAMASTPALQVENLTRRYGDVKALDQVSFAIPQGEFFSLLGPSGCGKTTLLRIIAGLDVADEGTITIGGVQASDLPAHRRPVNTVFQSYALFPHLDVRDNIAFGLRMKQVPPPEIDRRVRDVMALVEIEPLAGRRPHQLSGGQKQRVALARAIVNEPKVLLLDEPLAALDLKLRKQLQLELRKLQRRLGMTFIYVTHDQEEALVLSDRIALMRDGRFEQIGAAAAVYEQPRTRFASQFLGSCSLIEAASCSATADGILVQTALGELRLPGRGTPPRSRFTLAIRPEKVHLQAAGAGLGENRIHVRIEQVIYAGSETHCELRAGAQALRAEIANSQPGAQGFRVGQEAVAWLPPGALILLDD
jgi:spermidine/putrescine transport system ATP-binding protein